MSSQNKEWPIVNVIMDMKVKLVKLEAIDFNLIYKKLFLYL